MASSLAAGKAGDTKTAFSISLLPASAFLEVSTTQGLSPEVQSDNETSLRVTQLRGWSWPDPGTSHRETPMVPLKPCQSVGQCDFPRDLSALPWSLHGSLFPAKSPRDHLISSLHHVPTWISPFWGEKKPKTNDL